MPDTPTLPGGGGGGGGGGGRGAAVEGAFGSLLRGAALPPDDGSARLHPVDFGTEGLLLAPETPVVVAQHAVAEVLPPPTPPCRLVLCLLCCNQRARAGCTCVLLGAKLPRCLRVFFLRLRLNCLLAPELTDCDPLAPLGDGEAKVRGGV